MSSNIKYSDKPAYKEVVREEEGMYHRREIEPSNPKSYTTRSKEIVPVSKSNYHDYTSDEDNFSEWTTSKKKVHHKTRQVETRVSRQLLVEDGKVIADSGPQVVTRIKEDNKVEECEKEKAPKNKGKYDAIENAPEGKSSGRVLGEKKEIQRVSREVREENMQYHDERYKELTGKDMHQRAIKAPHELITINDNEASANSAPRGKIVHYSNHGKKYQDTDEILEVAKLAIDGSITKEITRKKHHEEYSEDELPDEKGEAEELRHKPQVVRSSRRGVDYVNDFDDPVEGGSGDEQRSSSRRYQKQESGRRSKHRHEVEEDEAFPRYEIDPLLNSLRDEDFKPLKSNDHHQNSSSSNQQHRSGRYREHRLERKDHSDSESSSDDEQHYNRANVHHHHHRPTSPSSQPTYNHTLHQHQQQRHEEPLPVVEVPEEYRNHKERLLSSKGKSSSMRERSFSPANKSHLSHRSAKSHRSHKEDASVQAHLTDEEDERKSMRSSSSSDLNSHAKTTKHLQRQSTVNSHRNYYYGNQRHRSPASIHSYSSTSLDDPKERLREQGARSKDSGFKSPHSTGSQQQIYSVSSKSKKGQQQHRQDAAVSPTPSAGQRSVKTTTTTMSAGLADRPLSRSERSIHHQDNKQTSSKSRRTANTNDSSKAKTICSSYNDKEQLLETRRHKHRQQQVIRPKLLADKDVQCSMDDDISLSSSLNGFAATTIKVPYKELKDEQEEDLYHNQHQQQKKYYQDKTENMIKETEGEMRLEEDIEKLRRRLANINSQTITLSSNGRKRKDKNNATSSAERPEHFDYKTIVANVQSVPFAPNNAQQHTVDAYNVRVIQHESPFHNNQRQSRSVSELSSSIAQLELLSSEELGSSSSGVGGSTTNDNNNKKLIINNNNEANFNLDNYVKHKAIPVITNSKESDSLDLDDDRVSLMSSCSLRSSRTYDIRYVNHAIPANQDHDDDDDDEDLNDEKHFPVERLNPNLDLTNEMMGEDDDKKPAAWIYDIRDGSSTAIVAPPKPKKPEPAKVDSKELAKSRGGQSYYLELVEPKDQVKQQNNNNNNNNTNESHFSGSVDTLYSRWNSQGALSQEPHFKAINHQPQRQPSIVTTPSAQITTAETRKSRQILPASIIYQNNNRSARPLSSSNAPLQNQQPRRQLPFNGPSLGNRSKSSSCLASSTRPTKYSIYGGLRQQNSGNKPVPRLSYSRAIGPKSQRQIDAQPKVPSRYLKMK